MTKRASLPGLSPSWRNAVGVTQAQARLSRLDEDEWSTLTPIQGGPARNIANERFGSEWDAAF